MGVTAEWIRTNSKEIETRICDSIRWLGPSAIQMESVTFEIDPQKNGRRSCDLSHTRAVGLDKVGMLFEQAGARRDTHESAFHDTTGKMRCFTVRSIEQCAA
jgi:hypothetical protein